MKNYLLFVLLMLVVVSGYSQTTPEPTVSPSNITFANVTSTSARVQWTPGNGEGRLVIGRKNFRSSRNPGDFVAYTPNSYFPLGELLPGGAGNRVLYAGPGNYVDVTGLEPGTTYHFSIYEFNGSGNQMNIRIAGRPFDSVTTVLDDLYVVSPANGTIANSMTLTINGKTGASLYTIEVNTNNSFTGTSIVKTTSGLSADFPEMQLNTTYYARVKSDLSAAWGHTTSFTTGSAESFAYLISPANGSLTTESTLLANLVLTAANYTIEVNTSSGFDPATAIVKTGSSRLIAFPELQYGTVYYVRIHTNLTTTWGATETFTTGPPEAYSYVITPINSGTASQYALTVNTVAGATSFTIEVNTSPEFPAAGAIVRTSASRTMNFPELLYNRDYYTRVKTDMSPNWGPLKTFFTNGPESFSYLVSPGDAESGVPVNVQLVPNIINGAQTYEITVSESNDFSLPFFSQSGTGVPYSPQLTGLDYGTTYHVRVRTDLSEAWGPSRTFTTIDAPTTMSLLRIANTSEVYPNRFNDRISFAIADEQSRRASVAIVDGQGQPVYTSDLHVTNAVNEVDNLQYLPRGIYYLRVAYGQEVKSFRIVKE